MALTLCPVCFRESQEIKPIGQRNGWNLGTGDSLELGTGNCLEYLLWSMRSLHCQPDMNQRGTKSYTYILVDDRVTKKAELYLTLPFLQCFTGSLEGSLPPPLHWISLLLSEFCEREVLSTEVERCKKGQGQVSFLWRTNGERGQRQVLPGQEGLALKPDFWHCLLYGYVVGLCKLGTVFLEVYVSVSDLT